MNGARSAFVRITILCSSSRHSLMCYDANAKTCCEFPDTGAWVLTVSYDFPRKTTSCTTLSSRLLSSTSRLTHRICVTRKASYRKAY